MCYNEIMAFSFRDALPKEYRPAKTPHVTEPTLGQYIQLRSKAGVEPAAQDYQHGIDVLYQVCVNLKMSYKSCELPGFEQFAMTPLEVLWWSKDEQLPRPDIENRNFLKWVAMYRMPSWVKQEHLDWAIDRVKQRGKLGDIDPEQFSLAEFRDGEVVQLGHFGGHDSIPFTFHILEVYAENKGLVVDFDGNRPYHEIYLSEIRRCAPAKQKTIIRLPVRAAA